MADGSGWQRVEPPGDLPVQPSGLLVEESGTLLVSWLEVVPGPSKLEPVQMTRLEKDGHWTIITEAEDGGTGSKDGSFEFRALSETLRRPQQGVAVSSSVGGIRRAAVGTRNDTKL